MPGGAPGGSGPIPYDVLEQGVFNVLDYACDSRVAHVVESYPQLRQPADDDANAATAPPACSRRRT